MGLFEGEMIKIQVIESKCPIYSPGDKIMINGALVDMKQTDNICVTALQSFFPYVYALRKGVKPDKLGFADRVLVQCPDYCTPVVFELTVI